MASVDEFEDEDGTEFDRHERGRRHVEIIRISVESKPTQKSMTLLSLVFYAVETERNEVDSNMCMTPILLFRKMARAVFGCPLHILSYITA
jgi:hypothetical protein